METRSNTSSRSFQTNSVRRKAGSVTHRRYDSVLDSTETFQALMVDANETRPANGVQRSRLLDSNSTYGSTSASRAWTAPPIPPRRPPYHHHSRSTSCIDLQHVHTDHQYPLRSFLSLEQSDQVEQWARSEEPLSIFVVEQDNEPRVQSAHEIAQDKELQAGQEDVALDHHCSLAMVGGQLVY